MKQILQKMVYFILAILLVWTGITLWVQLGGKAHTSFYGKIASKNTALILYNPDPIYNLDQQISISMAQGLEEIGFRSRVSSLKFQPEKWVPYDLIILVTNTYNWAPDWGIQRYIKTNPTLNGQPTVAITLGAGSTQRAQRILERQLNQQGSKLIKSHTYWLLRPNDEANVEDKNLKIALDHAFLLGKSVGSEIIFEKDKKRESALRQYELKGIL